MFFCFILSQSCRETLGLTSSQLEQVLVRGAGLGEDLAEELAEGLDEESPARNRGVDTRKTSSSLDAVARGVSAYAGFFNLGV